MTYLTRKKWISIILILIFAGSGSIYGQNTAWETWNEENSLSVSEEYTETPFRRGEIIFFLALPFVAVANILVFSGGYYIYDPTYDFTLSSMPPFLLGAMGVSTFGITLAIAIHDGRQNNDKADFHSRQLKITLSKKF